MQTRFVIACAQPHKFVEMPGAPLQGIEVLMVCCEDGQKASALMGELMFQYGWTVDGDGRFFCRHHAEPGSRERCRPDASP
jgi:hypothetical protein